ncbi:hypothetical protein SAMN06295974_3725 [Plantibacter flavus]|uniref:ATP-grasp domain-containing protein n=1 Tax=Plantibacter flavus TaxID=150123 RepID=A0A3N2BLH9_9MICO|nr:ATP-grasp domain-containing protein [Plantibacter flavus]ROR76127.1 hypothetical protein EDD42_4080 [Plantibacter flavus]SMG48394.1 hypothetical protein SAMN06295974_3725 [Plantibacter flavus]
MPAPAITRTPQLFSGDLRPYPGIPADWSVEKSRVAALILRDIERFAPEMLGPLCPAEDQENFWEDASRLSAAWWATDGNLVAKPAGTHDRPWTSEEMSRRFGPVTQDEEGGHHAIDTQINHPIVQQFGGRAMMLGSIGIDDDTDIIQWLATRHRDHGVARGVVKVAAHKNGIWSIELDNDPEVIRRRLLDAMDWTYIRLDGQRDALFVQDELALEFEYRLFIIDGEVVSGAGCVEEFTPLDRQSNRPFDSRMRRIRGHLEQGEPSPVEDRPDIFHELLSFGSRVASAHSGTVVIDVAKNAATGEPVVIELNGISNSGLYASDPWTVAERLLRARDRGYTL